MRKLVLVVAAVALGVASARAGGPPGRGERGEGRGFRGPDVGMMPFGMMGRGTQETDLFDVLRRAVTIADDKRAAIEALAIQYAIEERDTVAEVHKRLNKEYLAKVVALLPDDERPKYEKVIAAMTERDDAIAAATKELREALDKVRASQGADKAKPPDDPRRRLAFQLRRGEVPTRKMDALRTCLVLTDDQLKQIDTIQEATRNATREKLRGLFRRPEGGGRPDPAQMRQNFAAMRQARTEADEQDAKAVANLLTDEQKKGFATACAAIDAYNKKVGDAEAACRTKVVEAVGADKADAILRGPGANPAGPAPGAQF